MPGEEWPAVRNVAMLRLALDRVRELGQEALQAHGDLECWRNPAWTDMERTHLRLKLEGALNEQCRWLQAIAEQLEEGP